MLITYEYIYEYWLYKFITLYLLFTNHKLVDDIARCMPVINKLRYVDDTIKKKHQKVQFETDNLQCLCTF